MFNQAQDKDERAISVENSSYSLAYKIMAFAILADASYRAFVTKEPSWDLLGIVIASGLIATVYQVFHRIGTRSWVKAILLSILAGLVIAGVIVLLKPLVT